MVLTDASYHNPDLDGTTFDEVVALSKSIDPVNFYFVVPSGVMSSYNSLALATDGAVVSSTSDLSALTNTIISRYDSLPRVEDFDVSDVVLPEILNSTIKDLGDGSFEVSWDSSGSKTMVALNDYILGVTEGNSVVLENLDFTTENIVTLIPLNDTRRGRSVNVKIERSGLRNLTIPKAPNTGKR